MRARGKCSRRPRTGQYQKPRPARQPAPKQHEEPVQHVRLCQFPAVTGSVAAREYSHLLHVCVFNGNHALVSRAIGYGTQQTELWMTAKMSEQIANPSVRD